MKESAAHFIQGFFTALGAAMGWTLGLKLLALIAAAF